MKLVPENRTYRWQLTPEIDMKLAQRVALASIATAKQHLAKYPACGSARLDSWQQLYDALRYLEREKGVESMPGAKLKAMLVAAAADNAWFQTPSKPLYARRSRLGPDGTLLCMKCRQYKERAHFTGEATPAQMARWGMDQHRRRAVITMLSCAACRYASARRKRKRKPEGAHNIMLAKVAAQLKNIRTIKWGWENQRRLNATTAGGWPSFYEKKAEYLRLVKERIYATYHRQRLPKYWHELLEDSERAELERLYKAHDWGMNPPRMFG